MPNSITTDELKPIVESYLASLIYLDNDVSTEKVAGRFLKTIKVAQGQRQIRMRLDGTDHQCVLLQRTQAFTKEDKSLCRAFAEELQGAPLSTDAVYIPFIHDAVLLRTITRHVAYITGAPPVPVAGTLLEIIRRYELWASSTYEANSIAAAVAIDPDCAAPTGAVSMSSVYSVDSGKVLTNGLDTLFICTADGILSQHEQLPAATKADDKLFAPIRYTPLARWASGKRCAVALTRSRDILVFAKGALAYAKRSGKWIRYAHDLAIQRINLGAGLTINAKTRREAYITCLDASFSRTGACVGVIKRLNLPNLEVPMDQRDPNSVLVNKDDRIESASNDGSKLAKQLIGDKKFHELERRLRQELAGIDGAIVVSHDGKVIAAGTILRVGAGSEGGGRKKAAMTLGREGLGIKVSADCTITAFGEAGEVLRIG